MQSPRHRLQHAPLNFVRHGSGIHVSSAANFRDDNLSTVLVTPPMMVTVTPTLILVTMPMAVVLDSDRLADVRALGLGDPFGPGFPLQSPLRSDFRCNPYRLRSLTLTARSACQKG